MIKNFWTETFKQMRSSEQCVEENNESNAYHVNILDSWSQQQNRQEKWDR